MLSDFYTSNITRKVVVLTNGTHSRNSVKSWASSGTFSARIEQLSGREVIYDESKKPLETHRGYCASTVTVAYVDRWNDGTNTFKITRVNLVENRTSSHHYEIGLLLV